MPQRQSLASSPPPSLSTSSRVGVSVLARSCKHLLLRSLYLLRQHHSPLPLLVGMLLSLTLSVALLVPSVWGRAYPREAAFDDPDLSPDSILASSSNDTAPPTPYSLEAPDGSLKGTWLDWGATVHEFWVKDRSGEWKDLVLGFDNLSEYQTNRQFFGPIVGRYANRIRNGTFSVPPTANTTNSTKTDPQGNPVTVYNIPTDENNGEDTLHGGPIGYDLRHWDVYHKNDSSITFHLTDPNGTMGFPGTVEVYTTYTLKEESTYEISIAASADAETPILLSSHTYWNFDAYYPYIPTNPNASEVMPTVTHMRLLADQIVAIDGIEVPTGALRNVSGTAYDFREEMLIGAKLNETENACGTGCWGYDTCWIYEEDAISEGQDVMSLWSDTSGIRLDVQTNQPAAQVYICDGINKTAIPRKASQTGGSEYPDAYYGYHSCFVLEQEGWIDAINQPEWGQNQIYGPDRDYNWWASYKFSTFAS